MTEFAVSLLVDGWQTNYVPPPALAATLKFFVVTKLPPEVVRLVEDLRRLALLPLALNVLAAAAGPPIAVVDFESPTIFKFQI